jgi:hypothetical protein
MYLSAYKVPSNIHGRYIEPVQSRAVGYETERATSFGRRNASIVDTVRQRTHRQIESLLLDIAKIPELSEHEYEDIRPTKKALAYGFELVRYLEEADLDLTDLQIWPTDNRTIEFSLRKDSENELSFETGTNGISGNVYINGRRYNSRADCQRNQKRSIISLARRYGQHT